MISTPQIPTVTIPIEDVHTRLNWAPITESINGCPVTVTYYLVFYCDEIDGHYLFHGFTTDTTYVNFGVVRFASGMFNEVIATTKSLRSLDGTLVGDGTMIREKVLNLISQ